MGRATVLEVPSMTGTATYRVWVDETGPIFCDCPAHKFAKHGVRKPCKHMQRIAASRDLVDLLKQPTGIVEAVAPIIEAIQKEQAAPSKRIRFLEVQERTDDEAAWVTVTDLRRFNNLEV